MPPSSFCPEKLCARARPAAPTTSAIAIPIVRLCISSPLSATDADHSVPPRRPLSALAPPADAQKYAVQVIATWEQADATRVGHTDRAVRTLRVVVAMDRAESVGKLPGWGLAHESALRVLSTLRADDIVLAR